MAITSKHITKYYTQDGREFNSALEANIWDIRIQMYELAKLEGIEDPDMMADFVHRNWICVRNIIGGKSWLDHYKAKPEEDNNA